MNQTRLPFKNPLQELKLYYQRLTVVVFIIFLCILGLIGRLVHLQFLNQTLYQTLSNQNELGLIPTEPRRGLIYDRNGVLVADNQPVYSLEVIPAKAGNLDETLKAINKIIPLTSEDMKAFEKAAEGKKRFQPIPLKLKLTDEEMAKFYVNQWRFPGLRITTRYLRYYPMGDTMVPVLGFMARINQQELQNLNAANYSASTEIGKLGIEKHFEDVLHGQVGYQQVETDASGRIVRVLNSQPPIPGNTLYLTIDSQLQKVAQTALQDNPGAAIAIDPQTGEILAMYSNPSYDPNLFVQGISSSDYHILQNAPGKPLYNRTLRGLYAPGSTNKPYMALEGLRTTTVTPDYAILDPGFFVLGNHSYRDAEKGGHGVVNIQKAITVSCDIYFYNLALKMGIHRMDDILSQFGFGQPTHIEMDEELPGLVPSPEWKEKAHKKVWFKGDTVVMGIGQGYLLVTPLQMAAGVAGMANEGKRMQVHLLLKMVTPDGKTVATKPKQIALVDIPEKFFKIVQAGMIGVIRETIGTGFRFGRNPPYSVAAKTGTAQVFHSKTRFHEQDVPVLLRDNSTFIAYAPVENPKIAVAVVAEHSELAASVARQMMDQYLIKEKHLDS